MPIPEGTGGAHLMRAHPKCWLDPTYAGCDLHRQGVCPGCTGWHTEVGSKMPQQAWSKKRERQYEHIKEQAEERGTNAARAKEIAARTVNKDRAQEGESQQASKTSTSDVSPEHRGGKRSGNNQGSKGRTKAQLYADASRRNIRGRSKMTKKQLEQALGY